MRTWTDPDAFRHLIETLLRNALQATPRGGAVTVSIGTDGGMLRGSSPDNGRRVWRVSKGRTYSTPSSAADRRAAASASASPGSPG